MVKVAIPAIGHGLHASVGALQWTLTSYLLAVAALLLLRAPWPTGSGGGGCW